MKLSQTSPIKKIQQKFLVLLTQILANLLCAKNITLFIKLLCWFKDKADFDESED